MVAFVAGAPFSSTVSNVGVTIRGRDELILSAHSDRSPQPRNPRERDTNRKGESVEEIRQLDISLSLRSRSTVRLSLERKNEEKYRMELSTEFYHIDVSVSLCLSPSSAKITRKQRAGGRMEKYVGDQISSNGARLLARVYLSDGDRTSENEDERERMRAHNQPENAIHPT